MRRFLVSAMLVLAGSACVEPAWGEFADLRAMWVTRFDYRNGNAATVQQIVNNVASLGISDLVFQVRGQSDAYYDSNFEPRSTSLGGSWDPLQVAIDAAHSQGIKVHAWVNTMPLWNGTTPPSTSTPIQHSFYNTNPSFRIIDSNGVPQPLQSGYVSANPVLPEWQSHVNDVANDIVSRYDVDGLHLDYIRWTGSTAFENLPHDSYSHQLFNQATGLDGSLSSNASAYRDYIRGRVTDLVGSISTTVHTAKPDVALSAAVWRDPDVGYSQVLQDYRTWLENDLLDIAMPMIYLSSSNDSLFLPNLTNILNISTNAKIAPGIGAYLHTSGGGGVALTTEQLQRLYDYGADGSTLFAYSSYFGGDPLASDRRTALTAFYDSLSDPGVPGSPVSVTDFEIDEGYFGWSTGYSGSNFGILPGSDANRVTTEAQAGVGSQEIFIDGDTGGWRLRHVSGIGTAADPGSNLQLDSTGFVGLWLKTDDPGITVRMALDDPGSADRGIAQSVVADGQWHLYQWNLEDDSQWEGWVTGDGFITGETVTLDSIFLEGTGDATIYLDSIAHNPAGNLLPLLGDFDGDFDVDSDDRLLWEAGLGISSGATLGDGDADGDGDVDGADYLLWQQSLTLPSASTSGQSATVPEPAAFLLIALGVVGLLLTRALD